jgi:FkbM family methyltransferase
MRTIIEVGANDGRDTIQFLNDENNNVFCFEPTIELQVVLHNKYKNFKNFHLVPAAVDTENGFKMFNIAGQSDWGCSSLYEFAEKELLEQTWPGRTDFKITDQYKVMTMRLDTFLENNNITQVDYLWIDAQGNDFKVLQSLGDRINSVKDGRCEATYQHILYKNTVNDAQTIKTWLEERNFECQFSGGPHEVDVHFKLK